MRPVSFVLIGIFILIFVKHGRAQIEIKNTLPNTFMRHVPVNVNVTVLKNDFVAHFAKYILEIPYGFMIKAIDSKDGAFTFEKQRAKIVWVKIPDDSSFTITLQIEALHEARESGRFLEKFIFLEDKQRDETKMKIKTITVIDYTEETLSNNIPLIPSIITTTITEIKDTSHSHLINTDYQDAIKKIADEQIHSLYYCLQLGAFKIKPNLEAYKKLPQVYLKQINGLYKIVYGSFQTETEALKEQVLLQKKGIDCFVIKLNKE